eukprot:8453008-Lingulodinium_polyedra.AAC.1
MQYHQGPSGPMHRAWEFCCRRFGGAGAGKMAAGEAGARAGEKYKPPRGGVPTFASAPAT